MTVVLDNAVWHELVAHSPQSIAPLTEFLNAPALGALPERIAKTLEVPIECVSGIRADDGVGWSRQLLRRFRDTDLGSKAPNNEQLRFAGQSISAWRDLAAHVGARRLAQPLIQRVLKSDLDAAIAAVGSDVLRLARNVPDDDPLLRRDVVDWSNEQLADALLPTGVACIQATLQTLPTALVWRSELRLPLTQPVTDASLPPPETLWPVCLSIAKELNASWFS